MIETVDGRAFDADALLEALPRREIQMITRIGRSCARSSDAIASLGDKGEYNGFSETERDRTANLSKWLIANSATTRSVSCAICSRPASDEHAENYYDLASWIGLCRACHRNALHRRFSSPDQWLALIDRHEIPETSWARLISRNPFDLAGLLRERGVAEPQRADFCSGA